MSNIIISAEDIHKSFFKKDSRNIEVLRGVSLRIEKGIITLILGASGAGKSTLLHILSGLEKPDKGTILIDGVNINELNDEKISKFRNQKIGFIFQFHHLLPEFTALENVAIPQMIGVKTFEEARKRSMELLELVGLNERMELKPAELSGGEQQRVAVARALANNPEILFADEPTGNLDSKNGEMISELFKKINRELGLTILMVTHNKDLITLAQRLLYMRDGQLHDSPSK